MKNPGSIITLMCSTEWVVYASLDLEVQKRNAWDCMSQVNVRSISQWDTFLKTCPFLTGSRITSVSPGHRWVNKKSPQNIFLSCQEILSQGRIASRLGVLPDWNLMWNVDCWVSNLLSAFEDHYPIVYSPGAENEVCFCWSKYSMIYVGLCHRPGIWKCQDGSIDGGKAKQGYSCHIPTLKSGFCFYDIIGKWWVIMTETQSAKSHACFQGRRDPTSSFTLKGITGVKFFHILLFWEPEGNFSFLI